MNRRGMVWGHCGVQDATLHVGLHRQHFVGFVVVVVVAIPVIVGEQCEMLFSTESI